MELLLDPASPMPSFSPHLFALFVLSLSLIQVALKKVRIRNIHAGLPKNTLREIKSLENIESPHVLQLYDYFPFGSCIVLSLEYMAGDLHQVCLSCTQARLLPPSSVWSFLHMLYV